MGQSVGIDLFCGLGGFTEGLLAEGYWVVGFDIQRHRYPNCGGYPSQLVLQDVLTIHGSQFRNADLIVASPPCQQYSWLAMPWSRSKGDGSQKAKALRAKWETEGPDNRLFEACLRIQREAIRATGTVCFSCMGNGEYYCPAGLVKCHSCHGVGAHGTRHIPMVVENVRGAQEWVGAVFYGLDAWMKASREERWRMGRSKWNYGSFHLWGDVPALMPPSKAMKTTGHVNKRDGHGHTRHLTNQAESDAVKIGGDWFSDPNNPCRKHGSRSNARKASSAMIARIPFELSSHIARVYWTK